MNQTPAQIVRSFNRFVTRQVGALDSSFLGRGRPLAQARLLYEIGENGGDVRSLRARLGLDSGYLSRLIRALERQGLISSNPDDRDGRRRVISLSKKGRAELALYERRSDDFVRSVLKPFNAQERERLVSAMNEVHRLLRSGSLQVGVEAPDAVDSQWCLEQYYSELGRRFDAGFDPARSISATAEELHAPRGIFLVARSLGEPVGCGALKIKADGIGEIKRMWVSESARGMGVGRQLLMHLEEHARHRGLRLLRLETNRALHEAQRLYRRNGFREVKPFNAEPYAHHWFEKSVVPVRRKPSIAGRLRRR